MVPPMLNVGFAPISHCVHAVVMIQRLQSVPKLAVDISKIIMDVTNNRDFVI